MTVIDGRKVAIYIRWSTDDQTDGTTLEVQQSGCQHYVLSQGWQVSDHLTFIDEGYSGGNLDRPGLSRLRHLVKQGKVDCVVVFKVDRLSRSVIDTVNLVLEEWDGRTYLKSAREPIDTTTAMGKQFFYMLVSYAEWERGVIRERTVSGRRRRAEEGYKPSAIAPYGYRHAPTRKGALEIVPDEAEIVGEIFRLSNSGLGAKAIVNLLNERGIPYRDKGPWSYATILYMLKNRLYVGDMLYGKTTHNPRYGKEPGETALVRAEPVVVENSTFIPPIIPRDLFRQTQEGLGQRKRAPGTASGRANSSRYLLSGIAKCQCGYGFFAKEHKKGGVYSYACIGKRFRGTLKCDCAPIPLTALDAEIERRVKERFGGSQAREALVERVTAGHQLQLRLKAAELAEITRMHRDLEDQEKKVRHDYRTGRITAEEYRDLKKEIDAEVLDAVAKRSAVASEISALEDDARSNTTVTDLLSRIDSWDSLDTVEKKGVLRFFVGRLVAYRRPGQQLIDVDLEWKALGHVDTGK